jgi:hypothetical protein
VSEATSTARVIGTEPLPLEHELLGEIQHLGDIVLQGLAAEGGQEDVVRLAPIGLVGVGSEEAVADNRPALLEAGAERLVEALIVTDLVHLIGARRPRPSGRGEAPPAFRWETLLVG